MRNITASYPKYSKHHDYKYNQAEWVNSKTGEKICDIEEETNIYQNGVQETSDSKWKPTDEPQIDSFQRTLKNNEKRTKKITYQDSQGNQVIDHRYKDGTRIIKERKLENPNDRECRINTPWNLTYYSVPYGLTYGNVKDNTLVDYLTSDNAASSAKGAIGNYLNDLINNDSNADINDDLKHLTQKDKQQIYERLKQYSDTIQNLMQQVWTNMQETEFNKNQKK